MNTKRITYFCFVLACILFVGLVACDKEDQMIEDEIPVRVKNDFLHRYPSAEITKYQIYLRESQIDFIDKDQNEASIWYEGDTWKMTHTKVADYFQLPAKVQTTFMNSKYRDAKIEYICKTEREGIDRALYMFHFLYNWKTVENIEHYFFLNDDGLYLETLTWKPNDSRWFVDLPEDHFDFIKEKYKGADIRGYLNNGGIYEYIVLHNDTLKYISFSGKVATDLGFWRKTKYEISLDTKVPKNVLKVLKQDNPELIYTNLYYIEAPEGNAYFFQDQNDDRDIGYTISENIGLI